MSLPIRIQECELFDFDPTARMTLLVIALAQRKEKEDYSDTWIQWDCPWTAEEMVGWCDFSQWRLSQRVGTTEKNLQRVIEKLAAKDVGAVIVETWEDSNKAHHNRYKIVEDVIDANQRPEHEGCKRPARYKKKASSRGRFTSANQPNRVTPRTFSARKKSWKRSKNYDRPYRISRVPLPQLTCRPYRT